jgi:hypothetical protein
MISFAPRLLVLSILCLPSHLAHSQRDEAELIRKNYKSAYHLLDRMLSGQYPISFKKAVITTELTFLDGGLDTLKFNDAINDLVQQCRYFNQSNSLLYDLKDKENISKWASIFKILTDTTYKQVGNLEILYYPYRYDFDDFFGENDWSKMFVSKLLDTGTGNCHSLPYLYKIVAEEMGSTAHLALAPNHIYIKHRSLKDGWYNTELTSAAFPIDAWIMVSGYVHLSAIENKVYMKALDDRESIALCMIDLAEGYKRKTNSSDPEFILKCCNTALQYFPNYVNALILRVETLKSMHDTFVKNNSNPDSNIKAKVKEMFNEMQNLYVYIHELGYRQMPKDMYLKWLVELRTEKEKYQNKSISSFSRSTRK